MADEQIVTSIVAKADLSSLVSEVHRASASLQQLQRELLASNRAISSSTKLANNLFRDTLTGSGQFSSHFVNLNSDVDKFGKNLDSGRLKLKNYFQTFREHATTQKGMIRELAKEQVMLQNSVLQPLGRNAQGLMQYNVMIPRGLDAIANSGKLARMEMQIMNRALSEGAGSLINWGKNTQWAGRQLTVGLTVPMTMFGAAAGKAFKEADQELVRLTKVYGGLAATSASDLKAIREEVVETAKVLSKTMGASFKDTIALGADIAATGQTGNQLLGSIEETTRLAILGEVDRQDAMKATLSIQTAFKQNTQELTESINFLNAVENQTSTTLNDLVEAIPKAGPVIQQLGGDVKDLALYLTAMREGGISASEGANALKSGLASLINPTKQTVGMMSDFGIDVMGMVAKNTGDTTGLLMDLQKALDSLDPLSKARAMEQMFGKFQFARMSALLNNLGKQGSQTLQVLDLMKASTAELADVASRELKMVTESASGKYKRAIEGLKAELADVGEEFLGVATKLITAASKILDFFTRLPDPIKKGLTFLAGFTALVGPLIMLTGVLANFFGYITKGVVQLRAFFMKANGWKMLTPEIIAAEKAALMVENAFYSDAAAAQVLHNALQKLVLDYQNLQAASMKNAVPVNPGVSTVAGSPVMVGGRRVVDPNDPYVGDPNTRAMSHIRPRDINNPATIFGGVPGAIPVNRGISRTPQMYMHDRLPNIEGLTSVKGISTGIVPGEAAKFHALMATLGMQTEQEVATLKKTIAMGGTVSRELLDTFDDILPITQRFADSAATQSALIVQQMRNAEITVDQAKARILALNAQIETDMGSAVSLYAAGRGRSIDLTRAPMMDQPVVDANGQFTLRDLYKKRTNASVMEEFGRLRGVRTFGAPYSIQTTRMPKFNIGGEVESFGPEKTMVSGPSSISYDDRLGSVPLGGYVLNQQASMDPANAALVAMAPSTYLNDGGNITAALTPREVVFGPQIQKMPELYAAVDAANNGYSFGGQIMKGINSYGKKMSKSAQARMKEENFKRQYREYLKFINNPRYEDDIRVRMIMLDAAELSFHNNLPIDKAINIATSNFDLAKAQAGGSDDNFVKIRIKQVQGLERDGMVPRVLNAEGFEKDGKTVYPRSNSQALNYQLNDVREAMLANKKFAGVHDLISAIAPTTFLNDDNSPSIKGLHDKAHFRRKDEVKYTTSGYMGVGAVLPSGINNIMSILEGIGLSRDVLNLSAEDAKENLAVALKRTGMDKFASVDDIYTALQDDGKIKSKADWEAGRVVRANKEQKTSLRMLLDAAAKRSRWVFAGRPPRPMLVGGAFNKGGMIPGGSISRNRSNYGNISPLLRLIAPDKQLKILQQAREMSKATATGSYKDLPPVKYGHMVAPSSGMSYPIPGVSGLYKDADGRLKFFKGVPNEISAKAEVYGTKMAREVFGLDAPEQTIKTIVNPLDPSGKSKLLGVESPFDKKFSTGGTKFTEDEMIRQTIASLVMNNKDLSPSNVYGNVLADVGAAGVFPKASGNSDFAKTLPSMQEQAMINLLAVKGGARKDFAVNTASIANGMTASQYSRKMKSAMKKMHPKLVKFVATLPREDRAPYIKLLQRFEDGMETTDFKALHAVHVQAKRNSGGPIGGGSIQRGRYAYGAKNKKGSQRSGNPAKRAEEERLRAARAASYNAPSGSGYTASGNPQMQVVQVPYVGGTGVAGNAFGALQTPQSQQYINALQVSQIGQLPAGVARAFDSLTKTIVLKTTGLRYGITSSIPRINDAYSSFTKGIINSSKQQSARMSNWIQTETRTLKAGILREQAARTNAAYPGMNMPVSMFGPGLVGDWQDIGQDGIRSRKVGAFGYRQREYMLPDGTILDSNAAKAKGISAPRGGMGMGAQMGIGMAGNMAGMALMQKEEFMGMSGMNAGIATMAVSSIAPLIPYARIAKVAKDSKTWIKDLALAGIGVRAVVSALIAKGLSLVKILGWVGKVVAVVTTLAMAYKNYKDREQDAAMSLSMTAKAAEQAGIKYVSLKDKIQSYLDKQKLAAQSAKTGSAPAFSMPGIPQSVEDMKKAKKEGEGLKDLIESLNRAGSGKETQAMINNQKAQMVAAGMSIEQANRAIYGALANSNKAKEAYRYLADVQFGGIKDKASAAQVSVGNLVSVLADPNSTGFEISSGFEGLINTFDAATSSLIGTKDAMGNVIDEFEAYGIVMSSAESKYPSFGNEPIGTDSFRALTEAQPLLADIANKSDSIKGILAKWKLFTSGINIDLKGIDSTLAIKLAGFTQAIGTGISELTAAADNATTYGATGAALTKLQKIISATSAASQRAAAASQRSAQEELKLIAKKIKLIDDEKNKKLESLRATQDASNYALELQKLQIQYQDALSRGDMAAANRAQLEIDQLTSNRQSELAQKAIEDAATKAKAPLEASAASISSAQDRAAASFATGQDNAAVAGEITATIQKLQKTYNDLTAMAISAKFLPEKEKLAQESEVRRQLIILVQEMQKAGTGNSLLAKTVRDAFPGYFDASGKPLAPVSTFTGSPNGFNADGTPILSTNTITNNSALNQFNKDIAAVEKLALGITGGMTIKQLAADIAKSLGVSDIRGKNPIYSGTSTSTKIATVNAKDGNAAAAIALKLGSQTRQFSLPDEPFRKYSIFTYNGKTYAIDPISGSIFNFDSANNILGSVVKDRKKMYTGGKVSGPGTATSDSIPAMLSDGEYVFSARAVDNAGGPDVVDGWHKALRRADGGPVYPSWKKPKSSYNSKNEPTGSPYGRYWGELERLYQGSPIGFDKNGKPIFNNAGKDPWGGVEIPGLPFSGKVGQFSDYWHQLAEQLRKSSGPGMGIDKITPPLIGSGASAAFGGLLGGGGGNMIGYHDGGPVGHKHLSPGHMSSNYKAPGKSIKQQAWDKFLFPLILSADRLQATFTGTNPIASTNLKELAYLDAKAKKYGTMSIVPHVAGQTAMDMSLLFGASAPVGNALARSAIEAYGLTKGIPSLGKLLPKGSLPFLTKATTGAATNLGVAGAIGLGKPFLEGKSSSVFADFKPTTKIVQSIDQYAENSSTPGWVDYNGRRIPTHSGGPFGHNRTAVYQSPGDDFSELLRSGRVSDVIPTTPEGLLRYILSRDPKNKKVKSMLQNFEDGHDYLGPSEEQFLTRMLAATNFGPKTFDESTLVSQLPYVYKKKIKDAGLDMGDYSSHPGANVGQNLPKETVEALLKFKEEREMLMGPRAANRYRDEGLLRNSNTDGLETLISSMLGNKTAKKTIDSRMKLMAHYLREIEDIQKLTIAKNGQYVDGNVDLSQIPMIRSLSHGIKFDKNGNIVSNKAGFEVFENLFKPSGGVTQEGSRVTEHWTVWDAVRATIQHGGSSWKSSNPMIVTSLKNLMRSSDNGMETLHSTDSWRIANFLNKLKVYRKDSSIIYPHTNKKDYIKALEARGLYKEGDELKSFYENISPEKPQGFFEPNYQQESKEILYLLKQKYSNSDLDEIVKMFDEDNFLPSIQRRKKSDMSVREIQKGYWFEGTSNRTTYDVDRLMQMYAIRRAQKQIGIDIPYKEIPTGSLDGIMENTTRNAAQKVGADYNWAHSTSSLGVLEKANAADNSLYYTNPVTNPLLTLMEDGVSTRKAALSAALMHTYFGKFGSGSIMGTSVDIDKRVSEIMSAYIKHQLEYMQGKTTVKPVDPSEYISKIKAEAEENGFANGGFVKNLSKSAFSNLGVPMFEDGINMVPANMLAMLHKDEAVIPANMNPFNPNAAAAVSGSVYNINVELNGTNVTAQDVALEIRNEMRIKEMTAGVSRTVGRG